MSQGTKLRMAWLIAALGVLTRFLADLSHTPSERIIGDILALAGFAAVVALTYLPKVGNYEPHHSPRTTNGRTAN